MLSTQKVIEENMFFYKSLKVFSKSSLGNSLELIFKTILEQ